MMRAARGRATIIEIGAARFYRHVGLTGALGLALMLMAALLLALAWRQHQHLAEEALTAELRRAAEAVSTPGDGAPQLPVRTQALLPPAADVPLLLTRIHRAALSAGLGWPRADYRFNPLQRWNLR